MNKKQCFLFILIILITVGLQARTVRVGIFPNSPIIYWDEANGAVGIYADLLNEIAKEEGWSLEYVPGDWDGLLEKLKREEIDLMPAITSLEEREPYFDFSKENIFIMWGEVYTNKNIIINNISDLAGRKIGTIRNNANSINFVKIMSELNLSFEKVVYPDYDVMFEAIRNGEVDGGVSNNIYGMSNYEYYDLEKPLIMFQPYRMYFAVSENKNRDILRTIDKQVRSWKKDNNSFLFTVLQKWYGYNKLDVIGESLSVYRLIVIFGIILIIALIVLYWLRSKFKKQELDESLTKEYLAVKERYKNLFNTINDGVLLMDNNENIFEVNPAMTELFGYNSKEFIQLGVEDFFLNDNSSNIENLRIAMDRDETFFGSISGINKTGDNFPIEVSGTPLEVNRKKYYLLTIHDIRKRLSMQDKLRINELRLQRIFESNMMGILMWSWEGDILDCNSKFLDILGYNREDMKSGLNWKELTPPEYHDIDDLNFKVILETGICDPFEKEFIGKDGSRISVLLGAAMLDYEKNHGIAFIIDNSARKKIEHELAEKQQEVKQIYNMATPICLFSIDHRVLEVNNSFCEIFDFNRDEILNKSCETLWPGAQCQLKDDVMKRIIQGEDMVEYEISKDCDGELNFYHVASKPYYNLSGDLIGIVENFFNITEWKQTEAQLKEYHGNLSNIVSDRTSELETKQESLQQSQQALTFLLEDVNDSRKELYAMNHKLEQANDDLESFAYSVSHDLRAPLRHISGFSQLLLNNFSDEINEKAIHYLKTIIKSTGMMGTLIDDLLVFSRMGRTRMQKLNINLNSMISDIIDDMQPDYDPAKMEWDVKELVDVYGDPTLIRQVYINLIANSIKFSKHRDKARIEIGCERQEDFVLYYVKDNGVGFDMRYVDKLFGVFQRLHSQEDFEGTGIGLANVKRIISRHGGTVWAEGIPDEGASFFFKIPVNN